MRVWHMTTGKATMMAKTTFNLIAHVSYWTVDGVPVTDEAGYIQSAYNNHPGAEYHNRIVFYSKPFVGKGVWSTLDTIHEYRQKPEFRQELYAAAKEKGINLDNRKVYSWWVEPERVK
jgi:hypothetical protein